jgi:hypothetical protein
MTLFHTWILFTQKFLIWFANQSIYLFAFAPQNLWSTLIFLFHTKCLFFYSTNLCLSRTNGKKWFWFEYFFSNINSQYLCQKWNFNIYHSLCVFSGSFKISFSLNRTFFSFYFSSHFFMLMWLKFFIFVIFSQIPRIFYLVTLNPLDDLIHY